VQHTPCTLHSCSDRHSIYHAHCTLALTSHSILHAHCTRSLTSHSIHHAHCTRTLTSAPPPVHRNDLDNAYLFLPLAQARASVQASNWAGGINTTALRMLETRAYGWFSYYARSFPAAMRGSFVLNRSYTGTSTGLAKMPYLRDTRRSIGLGANYLQHTV
jgi:hypothetical protein